jgi:hypothetical protein
MNYDLQQRFNTATNIFISKGENREAVNMALAEQGIVAADIDTLDPRCLHRAS